MTLLATSYRALAFIGLVVFLLAAGYYTGLFAPDASSSQSARAAPLISEMQPNGDIALRTAYLVQPIGKAHRIFLKWHPDDTGELLCDETICTLTSLGEEKPAQPGGKQVPVGFVLVPGAPRAGPNADTLFDIKGVPEGRLRVVKSRENVPSYRLLVLEGNKITRVISLEPWSL
jgi:hypothetical protein